MAMSFAKRIALLFATGLATFAAAPPQEPMSHLLARMRERSGPAWNAHLIAISHVREHGQTIELRSDTDSVRFANYRCVAGLCDGTYFDGRRLYSIDMNGTMLPQGNSADPYVRGERTVASLAFLAPDFANTGGRIVDEGSRMLAGERYRTLLVENDDAVPMLVFVDSQTASVRYALPTEVSRNGSPLERYDVLRRVDAPFVPPHGLSAAFAGIGPVAVATDPSRDIPIFACTIGGIVTQCLLDSGNSGLSISPQLAKRLQALPIGSLPVRGLGDSAAEVVRAGTLAFGSLSIAPADYVVLPGIERFGYGVVLGADVFAAMPIELDPTAHRVVFGATPRSGGIDVPLAFENFVPVVNVRLGSLPAQLALDTGDESSINLGDAFYQAHHDLFATTSARAVHGVGGSSVELLGTLAHVEIGELSVGASTIGTTPMLHGTAFGHIGAGLLARFDVRIDYAAANIRFTPVTTGSDQR
jgi:hypothetical protein